MLPGVIDADYQGIVKIMVYTLTPPVLISKGIAQLITFNVCVPRPGNKTRGDSGFSFTGPPQVYLSMDISKARPECVVEMELKSGHKRQVKMLIDTGVDVTIISGSQWTPSWPTVIAPSGLFVIGGTQSTRVSRDIIAFHFLSGAIALTRPYVMHVPVTLVGRDLLSQMKTMIVTQPFL